MIVKTALLRSGLVAALLMSALSACAQAPGDRVSGTFGTADAAGVTNPQDGRRLAISHNVRLQLPSSEVAAVQQKHLEECRKLGCTISNTNTNRSNEGQVNGMTSFRIAPDQVSNFEKFVMAAPASILSRAENAEDKTLPVVDAEKRLELKIALRDRLTAMLRDPAAKTTAEILAIEKELSQVQTDIEIATAQRNALRTTTDTIRLDVYYVGQFASIGGIDFSPIPRSLNMMAQTTVNSVATLVWFVAYIVPWLPLIALVIWACRRVFRRRKPGEIPAAVPA